MARGRCRGAAACPRFWSGGHGVSRPTPASSRSPTSTERTTASSSSCARRASWMPTYAGRRAPPTSSASAICSTAAPRRVPSLELVMRLEREAAAAGGALHVALGNHELMTLLGDWRYVAPADYESFAADESEPCAPTRMRNSPRTPAATRRPPVRSSRAPIRAVTSRGKPRSRRPAATASGSARGPHSSSSTTRFTSTADYPCGRAAGARNQRTRARDARALPRAARSSRRARRVAGSRPPTRHRCSPGGAGRRGARRVSRSRRGNRARARGPSLVSRFRLLQTDARATDARGGPRAPRRSARRRRPYSDRRSACARALWRQAPDVGHRDAHRLLQRPPRGARH